MSEVEYTIIRRRTVKNVTLAGSEYKIIITTFRAAGLPPLSIFIREEDYTPEKERELILKKIEEVKREMAGG